MLLYKSVIFIGDNISTTAKVNCSLMHTFILERNAKFQLGISVNDNVIFFPSKFTDLINTIYEPNGVTGPWTKLLIILILSNKMEEKRKWRLVLISPTNNIILSLLNFLLYPGISNVFHGISK